MEESRIEPVPYIVHEGVMARQERNIKRLFVLCIIMFLALVISNTAWVVYESQFEEVVLTQEGMTSPMSDLTINGSGTGDVYNGVLPTENNGQS